MLLSSGFDPGVTGVFITHSLERHFSEIHTLDIIDVNSGELAIILQQTSILKSISAKSPSLVNNGKTARS